MPPSATPIPRACGGSRKQGGVYAVLPTSPNGRPIEDFLLCPPKKLNFDISPQGQTPIEVDGTIHLLDWIGETYYPNVADWIEETRRGGLSRMLNLRKIDLTRLTPASRLVTVHPRAYIHNITDYGPKSWACPAHLQSHTDEIGEAEHEMCAGAYWWDLTEGIKAHAPEHLTLNGDHLVQRVMPAFTYYGHARSEHVVPEYSPAIFGAFPIARLEVVRGEAGEHEEAVEAMTALGGRLKVKWEVVDA